MFAEEISMIADVWKIRGLTGSEFGRLELKNGRLIYTPVEGVGFDVSLAEVHDINFPWHYFGGGFTLRIGSENYRFSFIEPHSENADARGGRAAGKVWKKALAG